MNHGTQGIRRLDLALPVGPQLHRLLRERIITNDVTPGSRMSEAEIAAAYDVSRQPVREAFIKLSEEGLVEVRPQRGTVVRKIDRDAVLDARFVREAVEADIVRLLAADPDPALLAELRAQLDRQAVVAHTAPLEFIALDETFHRTLAAAAGKAGAWTHLEGLKSQMDRVRFLSLGQFPASMLVDQHARVVDRIAARDVAGAEEALRHHLRQLLSDLPRIVEAVPGFFNPPAAAETVTQDHQGG